MNQDRQQSVASSSTARSLERDIQVEDIADFETVPSAAEESPALSYTADPNIFDDINPNSLQSAISPLSPVQNAANRSDQNSNSLLNIVATPPIALQDVHTESRI